MPDNKVAILDSVSLTVSTDSTSMESGKNLPPMSV